MPDISCLLSVVLFLTANTLNIVYLGKEHQRDHFDLDAWSDLETDYIEDEWDFRMANKALASAGTWLNAIAWAVFCFPILQLAWTLSHQGAANSSTTTPGTTSSSLWIPMAIGILALGASMTEWIARLFWVGNQLASEHLMNKFNLDQWLRADLATQYPDDSLGWLVLEVNHIAASGFIWFVDAFEWLSLASIFILVYISVRRWRMQDTTSFGACWNNIGLLLGFLCVCEFVAEILRFEGFRSFGAVAIVYAVINRLILMPIWILTLAFALPRAQLKQQQYYDGDANNNNSNSMEPPGDLELTPEVSLSAASPAVVDLQAQQEQPHALPPAAAFTIDGTHDYVE
jgi:hypothetical protein